MKLKITAGQLLKAVNAIWPSVGSYIHDERKFYNNILIKVEKKMLKLHASNNLTFSWAEVETKVEREGETAIPGGVLRDIVKTENEDAIIEIDFDPEDKDNYNVTFTSDKNYWKVVVADMSIVPVFETEDKFTYTFDLPTFKSMLTEAAPATGRSDAGDFNSPYEWGAIEIRRFTYEEEEEGDVIRAATTDGHRIHIVEADIIKGINVGTGDFEALDDMGILVGRDIVRLIESLPEGEETVEIGFEKGKSYMILKAGGVIHGVRLKSGKFPPYEKIMERVEPIGSVKVNRKEISKAIRSARIVRKDAVRLKIDKGSILPLVVSTVKETEKGKKPEASYREVECVHDGESFDMEYNPAYLMDSLKAVGDANEVELIFAGDRSPLVVKHPDRYFRSFIMPVEIAEAGG